MKPQPNATPIPVPGLKGYRFDGVNLFGIFGKKLRSQVHRQQRRFFLSQHRQISIPQLRELCFGKPASESHKYMKGEGHTNHKLTTAEVKQIRGLRSRGWTILAITAHLNNRVCRQHVGLVARNKRWAHLGAA